MSQNRGYRRDNRSSYQMSNYGGRSGNQMNVNPWEGGMVPGGVRSGVAGLLPTPPQTSSLISQLSSHEAQLAIASNLLTSLLRPQQQQNQVPSLLSLGSLGQVGNVNASYRQSGFGQDHGRYQDRGRRSGRMDQRRVEPYSKGRHPTSSKGGPERKSGGQGYRSPIGKNRPASGSKVGSKAEKKDDKDAQKDKDENGDLKKEEDMKREDGEDGDEENKRDWKKEKKDDEGECDDGKRERGRKSRYHGIPDNFFFCHVCKKHMWDDHSFENHLEGRTHQLMMDKLDESYKIKVELMRHELQVAEQQREIEMERIKRQGRKVHMTIREYCTMCDLHFYGNIVVHRKNERHQQLKSFLHPKCAPCGKEFASRIEWDHHKLTPFHLRKAAESHKNRQPDSDDEFGIDELIAQGNGERYTKKDMKVRSKEEEEKDIHEVEKTDKGGEKTEDGKDEEGKDENDKGEAKAEGSTEDATAGTKSSDRSRIPKYNPDVVMAPNLIKKISGVTCRACRRFFINEEDSQTHCRTLTHYNNFVTLLKMKLQSRAAQQRREETKESDEANERDAEEKVDDEGNWKRRKVSDEKDDDEDITQASEESKADMKEASDKNNTASSGEDKYDPLEADAEADGEVDESSDSASKAKVEDENAMETGDEEAEDNESPDGEDQSQDPDSKDGKARSTRGSSISAGSRGSPGRGRGRKRK